MARYFIDLEFLERGPDFSIKAYSIGIVSEDGRQFYRETKWSINTIDAKQWVIDNVFTGFTHYNHKCSCKTWANPDEDVEYRAPDCPLVSNEELKQDIITFFGDDKTIELWGYYSGYDYVVFSQIFGTMDDKPKNFPYYIRDLRQYADHLGFGKIRIPKVGTEHNALDDSLWNKEVYEGLVRHHFITNQTDIGTAERVMKKLRPLEPISE